MKLSKYSLLLALLAGPQFLRAQELPRVDFNHFYVVIDSVDLAALKKSPFINNKLTAISSRTTYAGNGVSWSGTYLYGLDNYIELFDRNGLDALSGSTGMGLSVERTGEAKKLQALLQNKYETNFFTRERTLANQTISWFDGLEISDSLKLKNSGFSLWVMEYRKEYFDFKKFNYANDQMSATEYLKEFAPQRANKLIKRFTSITLNTTLGQRQFLTNLFGDLGYKKINKNTFQLPNSFLVYLYDRKPTDYCAVSSIGFESNAVRNDRVAISNNIGIQFKKNQGFIQFGK